MSHLRDPAIKLFGRNIPFPDSDSDSPATHQSQVGSAETAMEAKEDDDGASEKLCESELDGKGNSNGYRENGTEESNKGLKKPDKLIPCPRCNSSETKFCYFNNYNVNQPRHFCKNCHRYWTAGGTIRNVPVGAGRRRNSNKLNPTPQPRPDASTVVTNGVEHPGSDSPLCETMETKLNLDDPKKTLGGSSESSLSSCSSLAGTLRDNNNINNSEGNNPSKSSECTNMVQCYPVPQWAYPWSPGWNVMMVGSGVNNSNPMMTVPGFCLPNVPFQFVPSSYWGYMPVSVPMGCSSPSSSTTNSGGCSGNSSPTLGKHSRDANAKTEQSAEKKSLWVPKTLRIDDPNEAAKSSIWSTLGIEADRNEGLVRSGIFKPFKEKSDTSNSLETDSDQVLLSNPAALSRSHSFQEST